ncbi:hypothetical protein LA02_1216 [Francisella philomiragia]|uniref:hypothetical protein n=1 Tax=Francisella philomiragia TaxID=28110 RepID=UPI0005A57435|nr:hypothetical protein [Francisella philomiragia]AJI56516.1 hypothetical protein LA02_1216 [Francisella philomiragia]
MKNIIFAFLSLFFLQSAHAYIVKIIKDNRISQPGYITTIQEKNIQTTTVNKDGTKLYSIFRPYGYCLNITRLSSTINKADSFTSCFDNQYIVGNKVKKIILTDKGKTFYVLSDNKILGYNISATTNTIESKIYIQNYSQKIIDAKLVDNDKYLYLITASHTNQSGRLFIYEINSVGTLKKISIVPLSFKPEMVKFDDNNVYIQSDKSIYRYSFLTGDKLNKEKEIITISSGEILDFSVFNESNTESKVVLAIQDNIANKNIEQGAVEVYKVSSSSSRLLYQEKYDDIPKEVALFKEKNDSYGKVLVAFNHRYIIASFTNTYFEDANEYKIDGSFLRLLQRDNLVEVVSSGSVSVIDMRHNKLLNELFLKNIDENGSFISKSFIGFSNKDNINISQI